MTRGDRVCVKCRGTGRIRSASEYVDSLQRRAAELRREIAELTELYGLDLRHRTIVPGEIQARKTVGQRQIELAENLEELQEAMSSAENVEIVCPVCLGTGMTPSTHEESVLANTGDQHELLTPWH